MCSKDGNDLSKYNVPVTASSTYFLVFSFSLGCQRRTQFEGDCCIMLYEVHYLDFASDLRNAVLSKAFFLCFSKRLLLAMGAPTSSQHGVGVVHQRHKKFQTLWLEPFFSTAKTLNWSCGWIFAEFPQKRAHKLSNACWNSWPGYIMHLFFFACYFKVVDLGSMLRQKSKRWKGTSRRRQTIGDDFHVDDWDDVFRSTNW